MLSAQPRFEPAHALRREAASLRAWRLTPRQTADLELLGNGGFAPLTGFLGEADTRAVVERMHLVSGELWPIPVLLDIPRSSPRSFRPASASPSSTRSRARAPCSP